MNRQQFHLTLRDHFIPIWCACHSMWWLNGFLNNLLLKLSMLFFKHKISISSATSKLICLAVTNVFAPIAFDFSFWKWLITSIFNCRHLLDRSDRDRKSWYEMVKLAAENSFLSLFRSISIVVIAAMLILPVDSIFSTLPGSLTIFSINSMSVFYGLKLLNKNGLGYDLKQPIPW